MKRFALLAAALLMFLFTSCYTLGYLLGAYISEEYLSYEASDTQNPMKNNMYTYKDGMNYSLR